MSGVLRPKTKSTVYKHWVLVNTKLFSTGVQVNNSNTAYYICILELNNQGNGWWIVGAKFSLLEWEFKNKQEDEAKTIPVRVD